MGRHQIVTGTLCLYAEIRGVGRRLSNTDHTYQYFVWNYWDAIPRRELHSKNWSDFTINNFVEDIHVVLWNWKAIIKLLVSVKHNDILMFILTYWRQISAVRTSSGLPYKIFF